MINATNVVKEDTGNTSVKKEELLVLPTMVMVAEEREWMVIEVLGEICVKAIETEWVVTSIEELIEADMMVASMIEAIGFKMIEAIEVAAIMMIEETMTAEGSIAEEEEEGSIDRDLQMKEDKWAVVAWAVVEEADPDQSHKADTKEAMTAIEDHLGITQTGNTMDLEDTEETLRNATINRRTHHR